MMKGRKSKFWWSILLAGLLFSMSTGQVWATKAKDDAMTGSSTPQNAKHVKQVSTADHSRFKVLDQTFASGPEVTKACLSCHNEAGKQFHKTYHWTWQSAGGIQKGVGKKNILNNF